MILALLQLLLWLALLLVQLLLGKSSQFYLNNIWSRYTNLRLTSLTSLMPGHTSDDVTSVWPHKP